MTNLGVLKAYGRNFNPNYPVTRLDAIMALSKLFNDCEKGGENGVSKNYEFKDVKSSKDKKYVKWAYDRGITAGTSRTTFSPDAKVTREQFFVMLYQLYTSYNVNFDDFISSPINLSKMFNDTKKISSWALFPIRMLMKLDLIAGDQYHNLNPQRNISKVELAVMLNSIYEKCYFLTIRYVSQGEKPYCWAASALMVGSFGLSGYNVSLKKKADTLENLVIETKGTTNVGGFPDDELIACRRASEFKKYYEASSKPYNKIAEYIKNKKPLLTSFKNKNTLKSGHDMVVFGYMKTPDNISHVIYFNPNNTQPSFIEESNYFLAKWSNSTNYKLDYFIHELVK